MEIFFMLLIFVDNSRKVFITVVNIIKFTILTY